MTTHHKIQNICCLLLFFISTTLVAGGNEFCLVVRTGNKEMDKKVHTAFKYGTGVPTCLKFVQTGDIEKVGLFEVYFREKSEAPPQSFAGNGGYNVNWYNDWSLPIKTFGAQDKEKQYRSILYSFNAVWGIRILAEVMSEPIIFERAIPTGPAIRELDMEGAFRSVIFNLSYLMAAITTKHPKLCDIANPGK